MRDDLAEAIIHVREYGGDDQVALEYWARMLAAEVARLRGEGRPEPSPGRESWRERRAGLSWDQIHDVIDEKTWIGTDESGPTYQFVWTTDAADAIWELLSPYSAWPDD